MHTACVAFSGFRFGFPSLHIDILEKRHVHSRVGRIYLRALYSANAKIHLFNKKKKKKKKKKIGIANV